MNGLGVIVLGVVLALLGALWALQGVGLVGGSFMTGQGQWIAIGAVTALAGLGLVAFGLRLRGRG